MKKHVYLFPLWERDIRVGPPPHFREKLLSIKIGKDEVGSFVKYGEEDQLDLNTLKNRLRGKRTTECLVAANHPSEAIRIFREEWEGAKVGGNREELKALRIRKDEPIIEFPFCDSSYVLREENGEERFLCGTPQGDNMPPLCAVMGYDGFDECPVEIFHQKLSNLREERKVPIDMTQGYKVILAKNVMEQG